MARVELQIGDDVVVDQGCDWEISAHIASVSENGRYATVRFENPILVGRSGEKASLIEFSVQRLTRIENEEG